MFIINAPTLFTAVWSGMKMILDKKTHEKIQIYGSDFKSKLLEYVILKLYKISAD